SRPREGRPRASSRSRSRDLLARPRASLLVTRLARVRLGIARAAHEALGLRHAFLEERRVVDHPGDLEVAGLAVHREPLRELQVFRMQHAEAWLERAGREVARLDDERVAFEMPDRVAHRAARRASRRRLTVEMHDAP